MIDCLTCCFQYYVQCCFNADFNLVCHADFNVVLNVVFNAVLKDVPNAVCNVDLILFAMLFPMLFSKSLKLKCCVVARLCPGLTKKKMKMIRSRDCLRQHASAKKQQPCLFSTPS